MPLHFDVSHYSEELQILINIVQSKDADYDIDASDVENELGNIIGNSRELKALCKNGVIDTALATSSALAEGAVRYSVGAKIKKPSVIINLFNCLSKMYESWIGSDITEKSLGALHIGYAGDIVVLCVEWDEEYAPEFHFLVGANESLSYCGGDSLDSVYKELISKSLADTIKYVNGLSPVGLYCVDYYFSVKHEEKVLKAGSGKKYYAGFCNSTFCDDIEEGIDGEYALVIMED